MKQFIRWLIKSTLGRLSEGKEPTMRSTQAWAKYFFGGFAEFTKTEVILEDRIEVYSVSLSLFSSFSSEVVNGRINLTLDGK